MQFDEFFAMGKPGRVAEVFRSWSTAEAGRAQRFSGLDPSQSRRFSGLGPPWRKGTWKFLLAAFCFSQEVTEGTERILSVACYLL
jgi:hypothetical protein